MKAHQWKEQILCLIINPINILPLINIPIPEAEAQAKLDEVRRKKQEMETKRKELFDRARDLHDEIERIREQVWKAKWSYFVLDIPSLVWC